MRDETFTVTARTFAIGDQHFLLDGAPFQVISGALHYFRVHPDLWRDRLRKARQMGLNTVETYVAWNFHSSERGEFLTEGQRDVGRFIDLAAEEGLHVIVRPGPYICAEWRSGGLPDWLLALPGIGLRRSETAYLEAVIDYYQRVYEIVRPRLVTADGPVIAVQIENEYGAYGDDAEYLLTLVDVTRAAGIDVPLLTCDQAADEMLAKGGLPELHKTATFGSRSLERLATLRDHQPVGPLMCMEFWDGWFDSWGRAHHVTSPERAAADLDELLSTGASVNIYMFHGGSNAGTFNGANHKGTYLPITTSYDYDAPLAEDGTPTAKYWAFREVIARYSQVPDEVPGPRAAAPAFEVAVTSAYSWEQIREAAGSPGGRVSEPSLDDLGAGLTLAEFATRVEPDDAVLTVADVRDRASVAVDGITLGVLDRTSRTLTVALPRAEGELTVVLEDRGRVNYGPRLGESKGILEPRTARRALDQWSALAFDLDGLPTRLAGTPATAVPPDAPLGGPVLLTAEFAVTAGVDHFLCLEGWTRGFVWVGDDLLGRYSAEPPTRTLFVPGPMLESGRVRVSVLELHGTAAPALRFLSAPDLGWVDE
jgi:beta-galactosidase